MLATSFYHIVVLKKPEQTVFSNFVRRGRYSVFTCQGMMSRSMYCKSLDERLLEIAGIGDGADDDPGLGSYVKVVILNPKLYKKIQHFGRLQGVRAS